MKTKLLSAILSLLLVPLLLYAGTTIYQGGNVTQIINPSSSGTHTLQTGGAGIKLDPNGGNVTVASGQVLLPNGSKTNPAVARSAQVGTGFYWDTNDVLWVTSNGNNTFGFDSTLIFPTGTGIQWQDNADPALGTTDVYLRREAAGILQQGLDAAAPVAQILKAPDARAGTDSNTGGGNMVIAAGRPTGTGLPGQVGFQGSLLSTGSGSAASALIDRFIANAAKVLTNNSAIAVVNATIANGSSIGGKITYTIEVWDGTDNQVEFGEVGYSAKNKAGTVTGTATEMNSQQELDSGTLATTWAISAANPAVISINANSSLTPSTGYPRITFSIQNFGQQAVAIQ